MKTICLHLRRCYLGVADAISGNGPRSRRVNVEHIYPARWGMAVQKKVQNHFHLVFGDCAQRGAVMVEYLFCLPLLSFLIYVGFHLNQLMDYRMLQSFELRDAMFSAEYKKGTANIPALDSRFPLQSQVKVDVRELNRQELADAERFNAKDQSGSYRAISQTQGIGANAVEGTMAVIRMSQLLIEDEPMIVSSAQQTPKDLFAINPLVEILGGSAVQLSPSFNMRGISRRESGYHPNDYNKQMAVGFLLGFKPELKHWATPNTRPKMRTGSGAHSIKKGFVASCLMHFAGRDDCLSKPGNWFFLTILTLGAVKGVVQLFLDVGSLGLATLANYGAKEAADFVVQVGVEYAEAKVVETAEGYKQQVTDQIEQELNKKIEALSQQMLNGVNQHFGALNNGP